MSAAEQLCIALSFPQIIAAMIFCQCWYLFLSDILWMDNSSNILQYCLAYRGMCYLVIAKCLITCSNSLEPCIHLIMWLEFMKLVYSKYSHCICYSSMPQRVEYSFNVLSGPARIAMTCSAPFLYLPRSWYEWTQQCLQSFAKANAAIHDQPHKMRSICFSAADICLLVRSSRILRG